MEVLSKKRRTTQIQNQELLRRTILAQLLRSCESSAVRVLYGVVRTRNHPIVWRVANRLHAYLLHDADGSDVLLPRACDNAFEVNRLQPVFENPRTGLSRQSLAPMSAVEDELLGLCLLPRLVKPDVLHDQRVGRHRLHESPVVGFPVADEETLGFQEFSGHKSFSAERNRFHSHSIGAKSPGFMNFRTRSLPTSYISSNSHKSYARISP